MAKDKNKFSPLNIATGSKAMSNGLHIVGGPNFSHDIDISDPNIPVIGMSPALEAEMLEASENTIMFRVDQLKPRNYNLLVELLIEGVTNGGVHLLDTASVSKIKGRVIAVDEQIAVLSTMPDNLRSIKVGDIVVFPPAAYQHVAEPGRDISGIILLHINNVLAVLEMPDKKDTDYTPVQEVQYCEGGKVLYNIDRDGFILKITVPLSTVTNRPIGKIYIETQRSGRLRIDFTDADFIGQFINDFANSETEIVEYEVPE